jgi:glycine betaine catabolism B
VTSDGWVEVCPAADVPAGKLRRVMVGGVAVVIAQVDGRFHAVDDVCGHRGAALSRGRLEGTLIECPMHFAQFDVRTGEFVAGPDARNLGAHEVREVDGMLLIRSLSSPSAHRPGIGDNS